MSSIRRTIWRWLVSARISFRHARPGRWRAICRRCRRGGRRPGMRSVWRVPEARGDGRRRTPHGCRRWSGRMGDAFLLGRRSFRGDGILCLCGGWSWPGCLRTCCRVRGCCAVSVRKAAGVVPWNCWHGCAGRIRLSAGSGATGCAASLSFVRTRPESPACWIVARKRY